MYNFFFQVKINVNLTFVVCSKRDSKSLYEKTVHNLIARCLSNSARTNEFMHEVCKVYDETDKMENRHKRDKQSLFRKSSTEACEDGR